MFAVKEINAWKWIVQLHLLALGIFLLILGRSVFVSICFGLLLVIFLVPFTNKLESMKVNRFWSALVPIFIFLFFIVGISYFVMRELQVFFSNVLNSKNRFFSELGSIQTWLESQWHIDKLSQQSYLKQSANSINERVAGAAGNWLLNIFKSFLLVIFMIFFVFFSLYHRPVLSKFLFSLFDNKFAGRVRKLIQETRHVISGYVTGLLIENTILFTLIVLLLLIFQIKYAVLLAILAAIINVIPYAGMYSMIVVAILITLATGGSVQAVEAGAVFTFAHLIDANIVVPKLVGSKVKMNPFITFLALVAGGLIWGVPGMFLFIPLTAIGKVILDRIRILRSWSLLIGEDKEEAS
ncbi:MAG: hypothetical protein C5B59_02535 [Bacteroidetes bacterium]|nr:MAG: hypothetical protein C5B59_02535 [Bacteroidota bacterium]